MHTQYVYKTYPCPCGVQKEKEDWEKERITTAKKKINSGTHLALCDRETEIFENFFFSSVQILLQFGCTFLLKTILYDSFFH